MQVGVRLNLGLHGFWVFCVSDVFGNVLGFTEYVCDGWCVDGVSGFYEVLTGEI
ncbi:MAG: hypothetical protein OXU36_02165 [Candidatus Poribacteria bacterium]|nr:hypothetical protein [Candidatus Poribacteria bacterium]